MKTSPPRTFSSLAYLRNISNLFHPELPLTDPEFKSLKRHAESSFRRHLAKSSRDPQTPTRPDTKTVYSEHLGSVLQMPAFAASGLEARQQQKKRLELFLDHPVAAFNEHVSAGTASIPLATACAIQLSKAPRKRQAKDIKVLLNGMVQAGLLDTRGAIVSKKFRRKNPVLSDTIVCLISKHGNLAQIMLARWMVLNDTPIPVLNALVQDIIHKDGVERAADVLLEMLKADSSGARPNNAILTTFLRDKCWEICNLALSTEILRTPSLKNLFDFFKTWVENPFISAWVSIRFHEGLDTALTVLQKDIPNYAGGLNLVARPAAVLRFLFELWEECRAQNKVMDAQKVLRIAHEFNFYVTYLLTSESKIVQPDALDDQAPVYWLIGTRWKADKRARVYLANGARRFLDHRPVPALDHRLDIE